MAETELMIARMAAALVVLYPEGTPGMAQRFAAYRHIVPLSEVTTRLDYLATIASARFRMNEAAALANAFSSRFN
jgi:hypothetical protein